MLTIQKILFTIKLYAYKSYTKFTFFLFAGWKFCIWIKDTYKNLSSRTLLLLVGFQ